MVDEEGGLVHPTAGLLDASGTPWPSVPTPEALGRIDKVAEARWVGQILGERLRLLGFHVDLAPCLDLATEISNPVIGTRAFGSDPERVAALAWGFARGLASTRTGSCFKHFPGHGGTRQDSHLELATTDPESRPLHEQPFLDVLARDGADVPWIMSGHIDAGDGLPASLSGAVLSRLERVTDQYLIVTDSLDMRAVSLEKGAAEDALLAHNDVLLVARDWEAGLAKVIELDERVEREPALLAALVRSRSRIREVWTTLARRRRGPGSGPSTSDSGESDRNERLERLHRLAVALDRDPEELSKGDWTWCIPAGLAPYCKLRGWTPGRVKRRGCAEVHWIPEDATAEHLHALAETLEGQGRPVMVATLFRGVPSPEQKEQWAPLLFHPKVEMVTHLLDQAWPTKEDLHRNRDRSPALALASSPHAEGLTGLAESLDCSDLQWKQGADGWYFRVDSRT